MNNVVNNIEIDPSYFPASFIGGLAPSFARGHLMELMGVKQPEWQLVNEFLNVSSIHQKFLSDFGPYLSNILFLVISFFSMFLVRFSEKDPRYGFALVVVLHGIALSFFADCIFHLVFVAQFFAYILLFRRGGGLMPKFSVLIPCYNCSKTLPRTLGSCLNQRLQDFEIVLIDDCSKEEIWGICSKFQSEFARRKIQLRYFRNAKNSGVSFCRNFAWDCAIGEFICFLDADDIWHEAKLQIVDHFIEEKEIDCLCHAYTDHEEGFFENRKLLGYRAKRISPFFILLKNPAQTSCFVLRRSIKLRFDRSMSFCEDYDLWVRLSIIYPIYQLKGVPLTLLSRPQQTPGGLSSNRRKMRLGEMTAHSNFANSNPRFKILLPFLIAYSASKHIRSEIRYFGRSWLPYVFG